MTRRSCQNLNSPNCLSSSLRSSHDERALSKLSEVTFLWSHCCVRLSLVGNSKERVLRVSSTSPSGNVSLFDVSVSELQSIWLARIHLTCRLRKETLQKIATALSLSVSLKWSARLSVGTTRIPATHSRLAAVKISSNRNPTSLRI
jgi:hypothetical protein